MEEDKDKKKGELPAEERDVPQTTTGRGEFSDIGSKAGDVTNIEGQGRRSEGKDQQRSSDVNAVAGQDRDLSRGRDLKKDELR